MAPNPLQAQPAAEREVAAIIAFAARYYSGLPFEVPWQLHPRLWVSSCPIIVTRCVSR